MYHYYIKFFQKNQPVTAIFSEKSKKICKMLLFCRKTVDKFPLL